MNQIIMRNNDDHLTAAVTLPATVHPLGVVAALKDAEPTRFEGENGERLPMVFDWDADTNTVWMHVIFTEETLQPAVLTLLAHAETLRYRLRILGYKYELEAVI